MTIICALHEPGRGSWIGGDRRRPFSNVPFDHAMKWTLARGKAIGLSGDGRCVTLLHAAADRILGAETAYLAVNELRDVMRDEVSARDENDGTGDLFRVWGIIAAPKSIHAFSGSGCITEIPAGVFWADGSGEKAARGAAHALMHCAAWPPEQVVRNAVRAAIACDIECGGEPFVELLPL